MHPKAEKIKASSQNKRMATSTTSVASGATIEQTILNGVGKKTRLSFLQGVISASKVKSIYAHNLKEAEEFCAFGLKVDDLRSQLCSCHNPILKTKIEEYIKAFETKSHVSRDQNKQSIEKLNNFLSNAIGGVGLKRVIRILRKKARKSKDSTLKVVSTLLEAEYANLCAKTHGKLKEVIYERKSLLLDKIAYWLDGTNWKYGYNANCGKNASYIIYVYLPNGVQLSWHSTDYNLYQRFPYLETQWDGKVCSTMEKLLAYINQNYASLFTPATVCAA